MLRKLRITLAAFFFLGVTLLFVDVTDAARHWLGWMARVQFLPALMALNLGVVARSSSNRDAGGRADAANGGPGSVARRFPVFA